jgi:hypothetical protein
MNSSSESKIYSMPFFTNPKLSIGFTGSSEHIPLKQADALYKLLAYLKIAENATELHHGDCVGADLLAHEIATELGYRTVVHPPNNPKKRAFCKSDETRFEYDYLARNHFIINDTQRLVATPLSEIEQLHRGPGAGEWSTIRYARKLQRPVYIIMLDGRVETERMAPMPTGGSK